MAGPNDLRLQFLIPTATNKGPELWPAGAKSWAPRSYDEAVAALRVHAGALDAAAGTPPGSSGPNAKAMEAFINASSRAKVIAQAASLATAAPEGSLQAQTLAKGVLNERATPNLTPMSEITSQPSATYNPSPMPWLTGGTGAPSAPVPSGDFMGAIGQATAPAPAAGGAAPSGEPEYLGILRNQVADYGQKANYYYGEAQKAQAAGDTMAYQSATQNAMAYEKLRDDTNEKLASALSKTGAGAGGMTAYEQAQLGSAAASRAQQQAQFEAQMAWDKQQATQRIREAQQTTLQNLMTAKANATQAGQAFLGQNAQYMVPQGTQYLPGWGPDSAIGSVMKGYGLPFSGVQANVTPVDPFAAQKQIESQIPALLEQMKSWGTGG